MTLLSGAVLAPPVAAQTRDYAAEARRLAGDPVAGQPGAVWGWAAERGGWYVVPPASQVLTSEPDADCGRTVNPYTEPARALACVLASLEPAPELPAFAVRQRYAKPRTYPEIEPDEMLVLGIGTSLEGRTVVTAQYTAGPFVGDVFAFVVSQDAAVWQAVTR